MLQPNIFPSTNNAHKTYVTRFEVFKEKCAYFISAGIRKTVIEMLRCTSQYKAKQT